MTEVIEINDLQELENYQEAWNSLFQKTPKATFFHTYEWFVTFWKHYGESREMRVLLIRSGSDIVGIVPLCVVIESYRLSNVRVLTYPLNDWGMWYGPLGPNPSSALFLALEHIHDTPRDWDMIDLRWTSSNPEGSDLTGRAMSAVGWKAQRSLYQQTSIIHFSDTTWDDYFNNFAKKWRHEFRRQSRNLESHGPVEIVRHRPASATAGDGDPRWDLFDECVEVSRQSWQASVYNGNTICHDYVLPFIKDCHAEAARLGMLDMALLRVGGKPLAFQYNYHHAGEVYGLRMGYDQAAREWGVGKILLAHFVEDCFKRGDCVLELGIGEAEFKTRFRTGVATSYRYSHYPWNAWRSQSVRASQWVKRQLVGVEETSAKPALAS